MIRFETLSKSYRISPGPGRKAGAVEALRGVSAAFQEGGIIGVVGPNGAGKSTLFSLLLGFLEATDGVITIDDAQPRDYVRTHGAAYLPERFQLPRDWTIGSALRALTGLDHSGRDVGSLLEEFDLVSYANSAAHTLSRGTMQRVGLAQAFATPRKLVVLDEPTEGLDAIWRIRFRERVLGLKSSERLIFIASHDLNEVERIADRVLVLNRGQITEDIDLSARSDEPRDYSLVLQTDHADVSQLFENVRSSGDGRYTVHANGSVDLSARLAALLERGAVIVSVAPAAQLEERVSRAAQDRP